MAYRIPRNFQGTKIPGRKIEDLLPEILAGIGKRAEIPFEKIVLEWAVLLGKSMAGLTEPVSFVDGVLTVIVKSSTLFSVLKSFEKPRLMKKLQEKFQVKDIIFNIG